MAAYISHSRITADTPKNNSRISYLLNNSVSKQVENLILNYFRQNPKGELVTVEVFKGIGSLNPLAKRFNRSVYSLKQDICRN